MESCAASYFPREPPTMNRRDLFNKVMEIKLLQDSGTSDEEFFGEVETMFRAVSAVAKATPATFTKVASKAVAKSRRAVKRPRRKK
jgi:hypothetical protein